MRERIRCTSSILTLPGKAILVKLFHQNGECASSALRSYRQRTNATVARMISKFEASGCLDERSRCDQPSTRRNAAEEKFRKKLRL